MHILNMYREYTMMHYALAIYEIFQQCLIPIFILNNQVPRLHKVNLTLEIN